MKKLIIAGAALMSLAGPLFAADMPVKARPVVVVDPGWEGFYIGGNVGYSWGRAGTDQRDTVGSSSITECFRSANDPLPVTGQTSLGICGAIFPVVTPLASTTSGTSGSGNVDGFVGGGRSVTTGNATNGCSAWKPTFSTVIRRVPTRRATSPVASPALRSALPTTA